MMNTEQTARFQQIDKQIWDSVSKTVTEASSRRITFTGEEALTIEHDTMVAELAAPHLVLQFALADLPENPMLVLLSQNTFTQMLTSIAGSESETADESLISEIRPSLEAIVQGICLAIGSVHETPVVASGLSMRFQPVALTSKMTESSDVLRSRFKVIGEEIAGEGLLLLDEKSVRYILVGPEEAAEEATQEQQIQEEAASASAFESNGRSGEVASLDILHDIPLEISVELGRVRMVVKDVLDIAAGSIIEIDKAAGEPVDVLVNGRLVARGEVVVIEDNFGVRITEILSPQERLAKLGEAA